MRVIGAGFGRTGTTSLKVALEHIGYGPCYHMFEVFAKPERVSDWTRAVNGEPVDWTSVFDGFDSTVDWPGCHYWRELVQLYPDAKVVLTTRDPERWYDSVYNTIYQIAHAEPGHDAGDAQVNQLRPMLKEMIWAQTFGGRFDDKDHALKIFHDHNESVRSLVPADRLLSFEVSEGWEPLCEFLGVDVPDETFPHVNDRESMPALMEAIRTTGTVPPLV